ncbi:sigma-70 family RNA polymerase sigma factor [Ramlibacter ginsenosidimutans]|uniref:Sigma-70 family RNA polymerase sigma factor n=1 Tax=Ramlibacter ginsenosidimutans TaxID=502333 RepID=A0A934TXS3_9BURK|nr:sigma-70 family RNA polymerase sigma factor [Ramlibacter ginsenosidimutans]
MDPAADRVRFERVVLPHLDAAYNLARWLTRDDHDARDVVQEALLRALRYFHGLRGDNARPWLLQIVRHTCWSWLEQNRPAELVPLDDDENWREVQAPAGDEPQAQAARKADRARMDWALGCLPPAYREVIVLRELEDLSYKDIARIADLPLGTVMSRLARGREQLRRLLEGQRPQLQAVPGTPGKEAADAG